MAALLEALQRLVPPEIFVRGVIRDGKGRAACRLARQPFHARLQVYSEKRV